MRIVLTTFGSLGDLHPYLAVARELHRRGHDARIATSEIYREKIEAEGIGFAPVRPDATSFGTAKEMMREVFHPRTGPEFVIRTVMMPHLRDSYEDLAAASRGADLLVTHVLTFAGPLLAEKQGIPWLSTVLAPLSFFSVYDPPLLPLLPGLARLRCLGPRFHRPLFGLMHRLTRAWTQPVHELRRELGLPPSARDPMGAGQFSPQGNLALFSRVLADPQPDWPPKTVVTGFPFYDRRGREEGLSPELARFLDAGPPPIVFTLGSSAVLRAGAFYAESVAAARQLGRRAVLLTGGDPDNHPPGPLGDGVAAFDYAPYSKLFPRAAAIVHQGGIGTTAQALRAGRPMLIVPFGFDQPDNGARVARLGVGRVLSRTSYRADVVAKILDELLSCPETARTAATIGETVRSENGAVVAADAIEALRRA